MNLEPDKDWILIEGLELETCIGVPDDERSLPQRITMDIAWPEPGFEEAAAWDSIDYTTDYHAVVMRIMALVKEKPRKLIETLAEEVCQCLLREFNLPTVRVRISKFILPNTRSVSVCIQRTR